MMMRGHAAVAWALGSCVALVTTWAGAAGPVTKEDVGAVLARNALIDLGLRESPLTEDYEIAAGLLWAASGLRPTDAETARLVAAAAWSSGDRDLMLDATRVIIRNDPKDTVAQLRLVGSNINGLQTVERRLEAYERLLGPAGRSLDASVRSRLALDAALLMRENGDAAGFERRLREAVDLDGTNKDAVSLANRTFLGGDAPVGDVAAWQIRLLYADPLDPHVHLTLARICATQGAMDSAGRFMSNAVRLFTVAFGDVPDALREQAYNLRWHEAGAEALVEALNAPLENMRIQSATMIQNRTAAGEPTSDLTPPEDIRYSISLEKTRLLAAFVNNDEETVRASLGDLARSTGVVLRDLGEVASRPGVDQRAVLQDMVRAFSDLQIMRAIVGREHELIEQQIKDNFGRIPEAQGGLEHLRAWVAYAKGDNTLTLDLLGDPRPGTTDELLKGLISERLGDTDEAARIYAGFARARALESVGAFCRARLKAMGQEGRIISAAGRQLETALGRVPGWMDRMTNDPRSFMFLQTETQASTVDAIDPMRIRVRLRNTAAIPLGLGSSRPIGSRVLVAPRPISPTADFAGSPTPRVLEMDRRLRLEPLGELDVVVDADSAYTQWLREVNATISMRDRYRVIQSFQPGRQGGLINAPLALVTESPIVQRVVLTLARQGVEEITAAIASGDSDDLRRALLATVARTIEPVADLSLSPDERGRLARAWSERFMTADDAERAFMLLKLPHAGQVPEMAAFDTVAVETVVGDAVSSARVDGGLLLATLTTRVRDAESPVFELAAQSEDPRVRRIAGHLAQRLRDGRPSFATAGPGAAGLGSPVNTPPAGFGP